MAIVFSSPFLRFGEHGFDNPRHRVHAFIPPGLRIHVERDAARAAGVTHVVTGDFQARAQAPHQAGMHRTEAAEVDFLRQPQLRRRFLDMAV